MTAMRPAAGVDLSSDVAIVTGASSGLGRQFALSLAAAGAAVAVTARRGDRLKELVEEIEHTGGRALPIELDVRDHTSILTALDQAATQLGTPTILVNNAGIPDARRAHRLPVELVDDVLGTNVRGPWLLACEVARRLIEAKSGGRIVNISSMSAFHYAGEGAALYSVSKAAVNRMTEALSVEWAGYGINVNAIAPGAFSSEMMDGMVARIGDPSDGFPRKRLGDPTQLESTLLFLVSPASACVTGTVIQVDDGQTHR
jgi:NAD(P)-dependent dehydrogenase (short-subunit alcohol dehydrogenase family)